MITTERHQFILQLLKEREIIKVQALMDEWNTSESMIRRDLITLEEVHQLKKVHGGPTLMHHIINEPNILERSVEQLTEKRIIAKYAADKIANHECVFLGAESTTFQMIPLHLATIISNNKATNLIEEWDDLTNIEVVQT